MMPLPLDSDEGYGRVMNALMEVQLPLFTYICALTANSQDAKDILQETNLKICRRAASYDPSRPFLKWAKTLAMYEVMTYRKKQHRDRLVFSDDVLTTVAEQVEDEGERALDLERHLVRLEACVENLPAVLREVVEFRYLNDHSLRAVAERVGRSTNAVALLLMRARRALAECVKLGDMKGEEA